MTITDQITIDNFHLSTDAVFDLVCFGKEAEEKFQEYTLTYGLLYESESPSRSKYVFRQPYVYRLSDHWGQLPHCNWELKPDMPEWAYKQWSMALGRCLISDFKRNSNPIDEKQMGRGGDLENSKKDSNFIKPKITKDEIRNVISGTCRVTNGTAIQAAAIYLREIKSPNASSKDPSQVKTQEARSLKGYAISNNIWLPESDYETPAGGGNEQDVYFFDAKTVTKTNYGFYYDSWIDYFNNLLLHNLFFPKTSYELIGFTQRDGFLMSVVKQQLVESTEETNLEDVAKFLNKNGFEKTKDYHYENSALGVILRDLHKENVLTNDGVLYFIDAIFELVKEKPKEKLEDGGELKSKYFINNENGNPLELYHGTNAEFTEFKKTGQAGDYGEGIYFTTDKQYAQRHGEKLKTVNIISENPIVIGTEEYNRDIYYPLIEKYGMFSKSRIAPQAEKMGYTSVETEFGDGKWVIVFDGKNVIEKLGKGGDLENSEKGSNFINQKIAKDEIRNVISGTREVTNGAIIQAAAGYLRGNEGTGSPSERRKPDFEEEKLVEFITDNNLWYSKQLDKGNYIDRGMEQSVYRDTESPDFVLKTNNAICYDFYWSKYLASLLLHNYFFPGTSYELMGFKRSDRGSLMSVVRQHFVEANKTTNLKDVEKFLLGMGFLRKHPLFNMYESKELGIILSDFHDGNVLTKDDVLYFIDGTFYIDMDDANQIYSDGRKITDVNFNNDSLTLLAPNDKKSNLTYQQYELVRTPEFKAWFGDWEHNPKGSSKVVDENGEPLICFHGSDLGFNVFDFSKLGTKNPHNSAKFGFYFTDDSEFANLIGENVLSVFLNLRNPKEYTSQEIFTYRDWEEYRKTLIEHGYDGAYSKGHKQKEYLEEWRGNNFVAFNPEQIKLADGTNTAFGSDNPDIRFNGGGEIKTEKIKILYLHGLDATPESDHVKILEGENISIVAPQIDYKKLDSFDYVDAMIQEEKPDGIVGHSFGGYLAFKLSNKYQIPSLVFNPVFDRNLMKPIRASEIKFGKFENCVAVFGKRDDEILEPLMKTYFMNCGYEIHIENMDHDVPDEIKKKHFDIFINNIKSNPIQHEIGNDISGTSEIRNGDVIQAASVYLRRNEGTSPLDKDQQQIKSQEGRQLLAPNGEESNLTQEQYKLVRSPEFISWFGNWLNDSENSSKVVDENGEPEVVYHSSDSEFEVFDKEKITNNFEYSFEFHFSNDIEDSKKYGKITKSFFLNIRNPKIFTAKEMEIVKKNGFRQLHRKHQNGSVIIDQRRYEAIHEIVESRKKGTKQTDGVIAFSEENGYVVMYPDQIKLADGTNNSFDSNNSDIRFAVGGEVGKELDKQTYKKWKSLVNMSKGELEIFYNSKEGKEAGLSTSEAREEGINSGRESARWIMKMKDTPVSEWTPTMWKWAKKQISFISRMSGNRGGLYDDKGNKTRKHTSLLIWGNNPEKDRHKYGGVAVNVLLAPNEKRSNLTYQQYELVRTPEFKAWFGDWEKSPETSSKVVDENGEPLVVYHGSKNIFYEFNKTHSREGLYAKGFYFTQYEKMASVYGKPMNVFLSIKNPVKVTPKKTPNVLSKIIASDAKYLYGFDGVVVYDGENKLQSITVFEPTQIKLADGTNITFDQTNPDIRFDKGGKIKEEAIKNAVRAKQSNRAVLMAKANPASTSGSSSDFSATTSQPVTGFDEAKLGDLFVNSKLIDDLSEHLKKKYIDKAHEILDLPYAEPQEQKKQRQELINWILNPQNDTKVIIAFSGGKDSVAMVLYALELGIPKENIELWHHEVDGDGEKLFDWKCTHSYCVAFAKAFGLKILFSYAKGGILREIYRENETIQPIYFQKEMDGEYFEVKPMDKPEFYSTRRKFPAVGADLNTRWCSWIAKIGVMNKAINNSEKYKNVNLVVMTGERRQESAARSKYIEIEKYRSLTKTRRAISWRPIIDWSEKEIWAMFEKYKVQPHPCYELGWGRCSCQICIFSSANTWASINEVSPEKIGRIAEIEKDINFALYSERKKIGGENVVVSTDIYDARVNRGNSFVTSDKKKRWLNEAIGEFVSPIIVENWQLPAGAFNGENSGAN